MPTTTLSNAFKIYSGDNKMVDSSINMTHNCTSFCARREYVPSIGCSFIRFRAQQGDRMRIDSVAAFVPTWMHNMQFRYGSLLTGDKESKHKKDLSHVTRVRTGVKHLSTFPNFGHTSNGKTGTTGGPLLYSTHAVF